MMNIGGNSGFIILSAMNLKSLDRRFRETEELSQGWDREF